MPASALVPKPIWNWVSKAWRSMDDLAEKIDDLICSFDGSGDTTMDTIAMYVFGWMLLGLFVIGVGKYVYGKFVKEPGEDKPAASKAQEETITKEVAPKQVTAPGKYVPPTPPTRKRLGSRSGSRPPNLVKTKPVGPANPPPTATGPDSESVKWVNELFSWLYSDLVIVNELLNVWIQSLNEFTKKSVPEHGVGVEFVRVLSESPAPNLSNVFAECAPNDDVTISCDCEATPALQLKVFRQRGEKVEVTHYRLNLNRFRARLKVYAVTEKLLADIKAEGWPEVKVSLAQVGAIRNNLDETQLQEVICEIVCSALRHSEVNLSLGQYPTCPRLLRGPPPTAPALLPLHYDSILGSPQEKKTPDKRLLVKVIKAADLGLETGCVEPYCVVEVDEPPQKNQTSIKKETKNPIWEEHFLFDVNSNTCEILFEVLDRCRGEDPRFLGIGIVSMEELATNPSQRQTLALQSTPVHEAPVSGTLTLEFLLIEGADLPVTGEKPFKLKETVRSISPTGAVVTTTKTVFSQPNSERLTNGGEAVTDSALRELERNRGSLQPANKSTLIIHSVQRQPQPQMLKVEMTESGKWHEVTEESKQGTQDTSRTQPPADAQPQEPERGRSRKRRRDFFGTLRRRLKGRSRSAGPGREEGGDPSGRSISADRASSRDPASGGWLTVPGLRADSPRSSLSEMSGISGASSRTYVNEASTLVLETLENGINKYYLVPLSLAQRSKWKKKGTKLHIFNDHTFIAKHLPGGTGCQVCRKSLARRLGKQGYECRDCQLRCHKHCHVKADTTCPTSNIHNIELSLLPVLSE